MKNGFKYYLFGITIILFSSPLGYLLFNIIYNNENLIGEFNNLLNGFIHSFMLIGALIFITGLLDMILETSIKCTKNK